MIHTNHNYISHLKQLFKKENINTKCIFKPKLNKLKHSIVDNKKTKKYMIYLNHIHSGSNIISKSFYFRQNLVNNFAIMTLFSHCKLSLSKQDYSTNNTNAVVKPFQCHICDKTFRLKEALNIHIAHSHKKVPNKPEPIVHFKASKKLKEKDKKINVKDTLKSELELPWWCELCNRGFNNHKALLDHHQSKHLVPLGSFSCPVCFFVYTNVYLLHEHVSQCHRGYNPSLLPPAYTYPCDQCPKKFVFSHHLDQHMKQHSKNEVSNISVDCKSSEPIKS